MPSPGYLPKAHLRILEYQTRRPLRIVDIAHYDVILGQPWLRDASAVVDWGNRTVTVTTAAGRSHTLSAISTDTPSCRNVALQSLTAFKHSFNSDNDELSLIIVKPTDNTPLSESAVPGSDHPSAATLLSEFADVFPHTLPPGLPPSRGHDFTITLEPGAEPPCQQMFRLNPAQLELLRTTLQDLSADGHITPSESPFGAPILFFLTKSQVSSLSRKRG